MDYTEEGKRAYVQHIAEQAAQLEAVGIEDQQTKDAIDGYLQAAVFTSDFDGDMLDWSPEAQIAARDDVVGFITEIPDSIRKWQELTGHEWLQVGIDFWLTRNREGAGFWSRDNAEPMGGVLTDVAHKWPERHVMVDDSNEMGFE